MQWPLLPTYSKQAEHPGDAASPSESSVLIPAYPYPYVYLCPFFIPLFPHLDQALEPRKVVLLIQLWNWQIDKQMEKYNSVKSLIRGSGLIFLIIHTKLKIYAWQ